MDDKKTKRQSIYKIIMLVVLAVTITFMLTTVTMYKKFQDAYVKEALGGTTGSTSSGSSLIKTLESFKTMLEQKYIGEIDEEKLIEGAIKGYVEGLEDPYTEYLTKEEMQDFTEETSGEYVGIGVYITNYKTNNSILVVGVMKGSPALDAGMQAGDIIEKIDGTLYTGEQLNDATRVLKGQEGTNVKVTIVRDGKEEELNIVRKKITVEHVASQMLEDNIGYIQVDSFDSGVADRAEEQLNELKEKGAKGIILDLRSNGGGIVDEATGIADLFLNKGETVLITKGKSEKEDETKAKKDPIIKDIPLVVLVNQGSASASEILAGALKDKYGATIVGMNTYGKGVIQTLYSLSNGGGLKITTEEYYTPNHNKINKVGIKPDVEIELTKDSDGNYETEMNKDAQLLKAEEIIKEKIK